MITIHYRGGFTDTIEKDKYTEYKYDGKMFIVFKNEKAIAFINCAETVGIFIGE